MEDVADLDRAESTKRVRLLIKNPYNDATATTELSMELLPSTKTLDLKHLLEQTYCTNPKPEVQRIIYFGKLLGDDELLMNVFAKADLSEAQTVHLLIPVPQRTVPPPSPPPPPSSSISVHPPEVPLQPPNASAPPAVDISTSHAPLDAASSGYQVEGNIRSQGGPSYYGYHQYMQHMYYQQHASASMMQQYQASLAAETAPSFGSGPLGSFGAGTLSSAAAFLQEEENDSSLEENEFEPVTSTFTRRRRFGSLSQPEENVSYDDDHEEKERKPKNAEECLKQLEESYESLMKAIELSQRVQQQASDMMQRFWQPPMYSPEMFRHETYFRATTRQEFRGQVQQEQAPPAEFRPENADAAPVNNVPEGRGAAERPRIVVINVRLIIKLVIAMYFFGGDTSSEHFYWLLGGAIIYYLFDTGYMATIIGTPESHWRFLEERGLHEIGYIATVEQLPPALHVDMYYFLKTFFLSMIPIWRVRARVDRQAPEMQQAEAQ